MVSEQKLFHKFSMLYSIFCSLLCYVCFNIFQINWDDGQSKQGETKNNGLESMPEEAPAEHSTSSSFNHVQPNGNESSH